MASPPTRARRHSGTTRALCLASATVPGVCEADDVTTSGVIVVGGGPHGLLHALDLARADVDVTVVEAQRPKPISAPRAMTFHWSMMSGLDRLGILDDARAVGMTHQVRSLTVLATGERMFFDLKVLADDVEHPFTLHLPQEGLAEIILPKLVDLPNVHLEWNTRVRRIQQDAEGCTVTADSPDGEREYRSAWVVGADGAYSAVRREVGLGFPGFTWPERFVATNVRFDFASLGYEISATQLDPADGALVEQIDETGLWRYTYAENLNLPEESVGDRMTEVFRRVLPAGIEPEVQAFAAHRMHQRVADTFRVGRVLLLGDAAHVTNPTSGYGLAGGFFDSVSLVEALSAIIHDGIDDEILDRYSTIRRRIFTELVSPVSSDSKQLIWNSETPDRFDAEVDRIRHITSSHARQREHLLVGRGLESAPLRARRPSTL
ncbi:FAD-dependent oxidoreductase [Spirillospora sp. CA-255316]